jgi:hypothetical protein
MNKIQTELERIVGYIKEDFNLDNLLFYYSTPAEFIQLLTAKQTQKDKYPFFFVSSLNVKYDYKTNVCTMDDIVIATWSKDDWTTKKREQESMTILDPIYDEFLRRCYFDKNISLHVQGEKYPHYFYGKTGIIGHEEGIFPDHVDAIQLKNIKFRIFKQD